MKLNHDCVRELLIYVEENLSYENTMIHIVSLNLRPYNNVELTYTAEKLSEAGFINISVARALDSAPPSIKIENLTWEGHQFLDNIRDDNVWRNTKSILSKFSSVSLTLVNTVAGQVISAIVKGHLDL